MKEFKEQIQRKQNQSQLTTVEYFLKNKKKIQQ